MRTIAKRGASAIPALQKLTGNTRLFVTFLRICWELFVANATGGLSLKKGGDVVAKLLDTKWYSFALF